MDTRHSSCLPSREPRERCTGEGAIGERGVLQVALVAASGDAGLLEPGSPVGARVAQRPVHSAVLVRRTDATKRRLRQASCSAAMAVRLGPRVPDTSRRRREFCSGAPASPSFWARAAHTRCGQMVAGRTIRPHAPFLSDSAFCLHPSASSYPSFRRGRGRTLSAPPHFLEIDHVCIA